MKYIKCAYYVSRRPHTASDVPGRECAEEKRWQRSTPISAETMRLMYINLHLSPEQRSWSASIERGLRGVDQVDARYYQVNQCVPHRSIS